MDSASGYSARGSGNTRGAVDTKMFTIILTIVAILALAALVYLSYRDTPNPVLLISSIVAGMVLVVLVYKVKNK